MTDNGEAPGLQLHRTTVDRRAVALLLIMANSFGRLLPGMVRSDAEIELMGHFMGLQGNLSASSPSW